MNDIDLLITTSPFLLLQICKDMNKVTNSLINMAKKILLAPVLEARRIKVCNLQLGLEKFSTPIRDLEQILNIILTAKAKNLGGLYFDNLCRGSDIFLFHNHLSLKVIG